jgi:hypothetical protein
VERFLLRTLLQEPQTLLLESQTVLLESQTVLSDPQIIGLKRETTLGDRHRVPRGWGTPSKNRPSFFDRLTAMENGEAPFGVDGPAAHALLTKRGLTSAVITPVAEGLLNLRTLEQVDEVEAPA